MKLTLQFSAKKNHSWQLAVKFESTIALRESWAKLDAT